MLGGEYERILGVWVANQSAPSTQSTVIICTRFLSFFFHIFYSSYLKLSVSWSTLEILELTDWFKYILFFSLIHRDSNTTSKQPFIWKKRKGNWYFMHEIATENLLTSVFDTLMWRKWLGSRKVCGWSSKFSILASKEVFGYQLKN